MAVWGPHTDALSPNTWKLTVTKTGDDVYSCVLEGKAKAAADAAFKAVLSGSHTVAVDAKGNRLRDFGYGELRIDWDAAQTLPEHDRTTWARRRSATRARTPGEATVDADFRQVQDDEAAGARAWTPTTATRRPRARAASSTSASAKDIDTDAGPQRSIEQLTIKSRWAQTRRGPRGREGAGRRPVGSATASECWDANFASRYLQVSCDPALGYGDGAATAAASPRRSTRRCEPARGRLRAP